MHSDNGSNFRGAEKGLGDLFSKIDFDKVGKTLTNYNMNWKFIPPLSPWMRGAWESIVKLSKKTLRIVTHERPMYYGLGARDGFTQPIFHKRFDHFSL